MLVDLEVGEKVEIWDGRRVRSLWTRPPASRSFTVDDVQDGTVGTVVAVWVGESVCTVSFEVPGIKGEVYGAFAGSELRRPGKSGPPKRDAATGPAGADARGGFTRPHRRRGR